VSVIGLLITLTLGAGISKLEFATGQDSYLNKSDQVYKDNVAYQDLFGGEAMLTLITMDEGHTVEELLEPKNRHAIDTVIKKLRDSGQLLGVVGPTTVLDFSARLVQGTTGNPLEAPAALAVNSAIERAPPQDKAKREADFQKTAGKLLAIPADKQNFDNPDWVKFLLYDNQGNIRKPLLSFFPDKEHAQIVTRLEGNEDIETEGNNSDFVVKQMEGLKLDNASVLTTGAPVLLKSINDYLRGGMLTLGAIAVAIMVLILLVLFDVRWRLLPMGVILIGVIWAFGLAGYIGIPLTLVTIAGLPVMLGVGIDYAIQMHARVEEEVVIDREAHPIQETARNLGPALLVVTFDAIFAFAALRFAKVPMIRQFGLLLAVGIAVICLCSIIAPLSILGIREYKSPTKGRDFREGALGRMVVKMGSIPASAAPALAVASVLIFAGGVLVEGRLVLQTDPIQWANPDSQVIKDLHELEHETGSSSELGIFVQSKDVFTNDVATWVDSFSREQLTKYPTVLLTDSSIVTTVSYLTDVPGTKPLPPTGDVVKKAYEVAPADIKRSVIGDDGKALNIIFRTGPASLEERATVVNEMRDTISPPAGVTATPSGLAVVGVGLLENLEANRILLTYLAIGFVFLFLAARLRSVVRSLLSLVPVLIAVGTASLVAFALSLKLSPMTAVGGPLVVAACTEFTSLILLRFVEERNRGLMPREAIDVAASRTGRAFIVSGLTAISGVAVIAFSSLPLLRDFGIVVAMNVAVALLSALVILPPLLVWADQRNWVSKGLVKPEHLVPRRGPEPSLAD
jgi:hydrophobe/amphiphile efflux-3 (HAE3) family protein